MNKQNIADIIALTPVQEGMLYHYLKEPESDVYFEQLCLAVSGVINNRLFKKAWNFIAETNAALRTVFRWEELGKPAQLVLKKHDVVIKFCDFDSSGSSEELKLHDRQRKFDLREVPFRVTLCKLREGKYEMILTHHHILFDGWSTGILLKEFLTVYDALANGSEPVKVDKGQFKEYLHYLSSPAQEPVARDVFWQNYLEGIEIKTGLPGAKIKGDEGMGRIRDVQTELPVVLWENLEQFVKTHKVTLADLFYTAWGVLLQRYNNCGDVIFGTTVSGRSAKVKGIEDMVGLFINTLPLRITTDDGETVTQLLDRVHYSLQERQPYEANSLVEIKEFSRWGAQEELFDAIVAVDNYPLDTVLKQKGKAIAFDSYAMFEMSNYDLTVAVDIFAGVRVKVTFSYNTTRFTEDTIHRIHFHWLRLLEEMATNPGKTVSALDMLTGEEKQRLLYEYNDTGAAYPMELTIHERFEQQAARTPDTLALVFEDNRYLTYGLLNQRANRLAHMLRNRGAAVESVVGVIGEYSLEMAVGLLAVLKAGGAYATISPDYPGERVDYILKDSHASLLLALSRIDFKNRFPGIHFHGDMIDIEDDIIYPAYPGEPLNVPNIAAPHHLSFILYTSGSTGRPKGVMIEHRNVNNLLSWFGQYYGIGCGTRVLQLTDYTFDPHVDDIFGTLFFGSTLYVVGKTLLMNMEALRRYVERHQANLINCVPSLIKEMLCRGHRLPSMTTVIAGGDRLDDALKDELIDRGYTVYNHYVLIETTVDILISRCSKEVGASVVRPLANTGAYVVDKNQDLAPIGVVGELYLSGDSVGRGYLNKPELTIQKFISKSFTGSRGGFLKEPLAAGGIFRTGDLARILENGHVEILDRIDHQVKIRGFRIELGEIENRLLKHEGIKDAAVKAHDDGSGNKYLCGYIVPVGETMEISGLREYLNAVLPDYMVPARFMFLDKIPLTPIGKIDRKALPKPGSAIEKTYIPPRDQIENTLAVIWAEVLKLDKDTISITDDFFELGGHSLRATEAVFRTRKVLQVKLELKDFMNKPEIAALAEQVKSLQPVKFMEIQPVETKEYYDLSYAQRRLWIICQFEEDSTTYNMAGSFTITGSINDRAFEKAVKTLVRRHESFRTVFFSVNGQPKQRILNDIDWHLGRVDLRSLGDTELRRQKAKEIIRETANRPFNLERGPLFAFKLLRLDEEEYLLVANIHHIINDGWSLGIINNEIFTLYNNYKHNHEHGLPRLKYQYRDYTLWHNALIRGGHLDSFGRYWLEKFKDKPTGIELPLDHPRGSVQTFNGGRVYFTIEANPVKALHQVCPETGATSYMKYLALIAILLYRYTAQQDIIIASPNAGRNNPDLHHMIGFLVNTMVTRNMVNPESSFRQLLQAVKEETVACYENQDFPFDVLVERLGLDRDLSRSPIFNVILAFDNTEVDDRSLKMEGVTFTYNTQIDEFTPSAFDLNFIMDEVGGRVNGEIMYNRDLFERATIERLAMNFQNLVKRIPALQDECCGRLPFMDDEEYDTVTRGFNQTAVPFPAVTLQAMLENRAAAGADMIAVVADDNALTYGQLNRRANRLAHFLRREYPVTPGTIVGIAMDRSIEMVMAILGVIKSGAGYLAIDPAYPPDRVLHMLTDSRAPLTITDKERPLLFENYEGTIIDIHSLSYISQSQENPDIINTANDILYVIYTSGSTGMPNGAMLSQGILTNLIQWQNTQTSINSAHRCLQFTSTSFCVSFQEIMITLVSGGEVHLIGDVERQDIDYLMHFLAKHRIEILYLPFSYLNFLFTESGRWGKGFKHSLQHIITAGEQLKVTSGLKQFLEANPRVKLHNHYGSSEMHVVTAYTLDAAGAAQTPIPPAGRPVANTRIYILDEYNNPVPIGVWGELCISGSTEIAGYIHNKELTAKKLLDHPIPGNDGKRLYRSGDIGRWLADGNIELKGRKDFQVKVRGFRVELSEVESKILAVGGVRDCVVVVKEAGPGEKMLVAYVVLDGIDAAKIKRIIKNYLPHYMIPKFVALDALPLMSNGKVDRDRLPAFTQGPTTGEDKLPEISPDRIDALMADTSVQVGLEFVIARLGRFAVGRILPNGARIAGIDIDIFRGEENRLGPTAARLFEEQAARTPDATAVVTADYAISYQALNLRANRLASWLRKKGVTHGSTVGLMVAPSLEMIVGILGILKAGGNYLPISPGISTDAIISLLEDHQARILLTSGKDLGKHPFALLQDVDTITHPPLITAPRPQIMDFDGLPVPDRSLVSYEKYNRHIGLGMVKNTITLQATRGCPYNCLYCHKIWPKKHVFRSAENIFQEVAHYYRLGVRRFVFADDIFNLDNRNSRRFFELVVKNKLDINIFFPNGLRSDLLTPDYIDLMVEAGTAGLGMALETASPRLQKLIRKHLHLDKLRENIEYFCQRHPQVILELFTMHGFPTETEEEALMTFDFVKGRHWLDFPYLLILKIYPNTDMATLALEKGIPQEAITRSAHMAYHELPETLPFDKGFTLKYQSDFANEYFLLKERLLAKMPYQMKVMTPDEMVEKYNSYLPVEIKTFAEMLGFLGLRPGELGLELDEYGSPLPETYPLVRQGIKPQNLDAGIRRLFSRPGLNEPDPDALRILLLDLSQFFSHEREMLYDGVEPPLGLMALLTYLKRELGPRVNGRIAKSRVDFDHYDELKALLKEFKPQVIGIRTLSHHRDFFHKTVTMMRQWGVDVPIIAGGPYATSGCTAILQDRHVDLVVLSEGELTFTELTREMLKTNGQLPAAAVLEKIQGIAFIPQKQGSVVPTCREILLMDGLEEALARETDTDQVETVSIVTGDHKDDPDRRKPLVSWVFDGAAQQVFNALAQGGSLCVAPEVGGNIGDVALMEFYRVKDTRAGEPAFNIRLELPENSPLLKKQRFENDIEEKLAEIWSELLGVDKNIIGRDDSFFELGGHSLKAATMMTKIHKTFNKSIKLIEIFKAPTLRGIGELIRGEVANLFTAISAVEKREYYPLSAAQRRMYILQQMELESIAYNMPQVFVVHNPEPALWEKLLHTFRELLDRHESLRTSFHIVNGAPVQRIHDRVDFAIEYYNLATEGTEVTENIEIKKFIRPFDLSRAPLLRVGVFEVSPGRCLIVTDMHHIISDGVSVQVLVRDFGALFAGTVLEPLRLHYKDFSQWQNHETEQAAIKQQGNYWRQQLAGEMPLLNLPTDFARPAVQSFAGHESRFEVDHETTAALIALALAQGTTLYMVLLSVYTILLAKLGGQEDIIVGTPVAGRKHADLEHIIGMFVNTLPLRNFPAGDRTFNAFLAEVKQRTLDGFANQDYPYEALVEEMGLERDVSRNPLFDTMFALQNTARLEIDLPGLKLETYEDTNMMPIAKFDLTLQAIEAGDRLSFIFEYGTKLFKEETIQRFTGYFKRILAAVPADPGKVISDLEIISEEEKKQLLFQFNDTAAAYPHDITIHQLFEEQAARTPDRIALFGESVGLVGPVGPVRLVRPVNLTYRQLNGQSDRIAGLLIEKGVLADNIVAIRVGRFLEMIIGILGILKSGGAYLPIDPEYPQERIEYMLKDSGAKWLVNQTFFGGCRGAILQKSPLAGSNLAYIIYTSGSTGKPKGVMIEHRNVVRLLFNEKFQFDFSENDTWTLFHSYCFDFSVWEMYGALLYGGRLIIVPRTTAQDTETFYELLCREKVTILNQTPPAFYQLAGHVLSDNTSRWELCLRYVIFGGEALNPSRLEGWQKKYPAVKLINMYGITETTVHVTYKEIKQKEIETTISNIGTPIPTLTVYIMDKYMNLLPLGVAGELFVGGAGVGRGYLNRPELTVNRFINFHHSSFIIHHSKFYRSGDLARRLAGGELEYLGRIDRQVKIRGYRVELGEIEARLLEHPGIKEAVVSMGTSRTGDNYLCAYLVTSKNPDAAALPGYLGKHLPAYMIPAYFIFLEKIPLTANGKVDRRALPVPEIKISTDYVAPANEIEERLAITWADVLEIEKDKLSVTADFFQLGGHSLKAAVLAARIRKEFNVAVPLVELFKAPTIKELAVFIKGAVKGTFEAITPVEKKEYYELSAAQKRLFVLQQMVEQGTGYNIPAILVLEGHLDQPKLADTFQRLIARHENLRTSFEIIAGKPVQKIHDQVLFELTVKCDDRHKDFVKPFDLTRAPLIRVELLKLAETKHLLMIDMHHIIADGISIEVFIKEFSILYRGGELPALGIQYKDFSAWQARREAAGLLNTQETYWLNEFSGEITKLDLPTDFPRPSIWSFAADTLTFEIGPGETARLHSLAFEANATLFMMLLTIYTIMLAKLSGQEEIVVGSPVAGRGHADLENIMGMFVNTLALRTYPCGKKTVLEFLKETRDKTLQALENQDYPFEELVEKVTVDRDVSRNPLVDVTFTLQNFFDISDTGLTLEIDGLTLKPYGDAHKTAKFDLMLSASEKDEHLRFTFEYSTQLFTQETITRFHDYFKQIIAIVIENPTMPVPLIEIISDEEKNRVLYEFNRTELPYPNDKTLHGLFAGQAIKTPDHIAVYGHGRTRTNTDNNMGLSYRELNEKADRVAYLLMEKGVGPERIVGIMMKRSLDLIIGILGILKTGGAYLPISAAYPEERIAYMLKESGAKVLITKFENKNRNFEIPFVLNFEHLNFEFVSNFDIRISDFNSPNHLAYIIYTSGSTGKPKGVPITHANVCPLFHWVYREMRLGPNDRTIQNLSYFFDGSVMEIFSTLTSGATLYMAGDDIMTNPEACIDFIRQNAITFLFSTPTQWRYLFNTGKKMETLKYLVTGAEKLTFDLLEQSYKVVREDCRIFNMYGPTEAGIITAVYEIRRPDDRPYQTLSSVPIGRTVGNNVLLVLDKDKNLCPVNTWGELHIGGDGVAGGYLNNPELTRERFILPPVAKNPFEKGFLDFPKLLINFQSLFYRTGDRVRWLPGGELEFYNRIDQQVKIRGYRVELGEIEARLMNHENIKDAVVIIFTGNSGDSFLAAYFVADKEPDTTALKEYLKKELPDYMIPTYFIRLEQIPVTPTGKVDRKALPEPGISNLNNYVAPRNPWEEKLAALWAGVLGVNGEANPIGIDDDFFRLGGHSLKATMLTARIHKEFDVQVPLLEIFKTPTIRELANYIKNKEKENYRAVEAVEKKEYYPLSSAQKRLYILKQIESVGTGYNIPAVMIIEGGLNKEKLATVCRKLIQRHESFRTSFAILNEEPIQRIHEKVAFEINNYLATAEHGQKSAPEAIIASFIQPFDLSCAPLLRVGLLELEKKDTVLLMIDMHHIISDGTSIGIFINEFSRLYEGKELAPLRIQYRDFSEWQKREKEKSGTRAQAEYWLKEFGSDVRDVRDVRELSRIAIPCDFPRPAVQSFAGEKYHLVVGNLETETLKKRAREENVTLFMLLMAIFDIMLWKISGTEDIVVGTPVAGRRHADLESIIGMFVNTLALKVQINPGKENCFGEFLEQVKQKNLDAFENQDYQFEDLVEATQLNRDLGRNPIFDVLFVLQNMGIPVIEIPGLKMTPFPFETHIAPFDIYLMAEEQENCLYFTTGYCTKLFKEDTIRRFMGYFTKILTTVSFERATNLKLTEIEILSVAEKYQILVEFNNTETEYANYSANLTVHELFERQVERTPEAIAVVGTSIDVNDVNNVSITYRELNLKANRLAHRLKQKGVGRDTIVSVIMPRSIDMVAAILGIIKAGGAYLPINPAYPMQRILAILKDNGGRYVLTDSETSRYFPFTVLRGMTWRDISPMVTGRQTQVKNFDSLPHPDRTLVDYRKYHQFIGIAPVKYTVNIQATRGCPYGCAYCHKIWPKTHVSRSAENIFAEIRNCYEAGVKRFVFIDDIFNLHKENSTRLFETIIKNNYNVQLFFPNGLRGDILTPDFIDLMVAAGTVNIDLALETASPRLQKLIGKQLNLEKFAENVHHITKKHPQVILEMEMMIGFPTETEAEAMMTLDLLKRFQWVHFPNLNILKIYPNTDMGKLALANGVSKESIAHSVGLAFHELPETLPFSKDFARKYQAQFMNDYFLSKERLIHVIRNQAKTLSQDELVQKYDSYLPATIKNFQDILTGVDISQEELGPLDFLPGDGMTMAAPGFNERIKSYYPPRPSGVGNVGNVFRVLLMDLSQLFRRESHDALYDVGAEPLGLMYLATYIHEQLGPSAAVKIIKSRIDFDNYEELEKEVLSFKPHLIGIRTLSLYKEFFHRTVSVLKHCGVTAPIITGGPYATSDYRQLLQDYNVDLAVLGEGELTAVQLVKAMINNHNRWPAEEILNTIPGLAYIREQDKNASRPAVYGGEVLLTDYIFHAFHRADHLSADNPENINRPTDLFYLISTSGSTGIPKSVMLEHRTMVNLINYQLTCTGIDFSRVLQFAAIGFDVSLQEIFSALLGGGTVFLPDEEVKRDIPRLCDFIARNRVNILFLPPAFLRFIFSEPAYIREFPRTVQHIIAAGEQLVIDEPLATYLKEKGIFLHNHYGPSETHVVTTLTLEPGSEIPRLPGIGKPVFMTGIYILDKYNHIQPIGVTGELCIGGIQVGRGYLNRPDLTMEKFGQIKKAKITKSFTGVQGGKLRVFQKSPLEIYRTGDLARWLPDGNIEFLGRIDYQVKIRGFRIEPGEIESLLLKYNHVKEALVIDHESKSGEKYLCAYIVPQGDFNIDTGEIRNYLSHQLPDYMIPGHFIFLASIPLNSNRKVDRRALPDPLGTGSSTIAETYIAPANAIEAKLVDIWSEILSIEKSKIGVRDNFFELGGHSLKATLLMAKIHKMLNINIPLAEIFRAPSIRGLAGYLKTAAPLQYIDIEPVEKKSVYPLTYNQKRLWLLQQMDPAGSAYHMPGVIPLAFNVDVQVLKAVLAEIVARHESLRTGFKETQGEPVQFIRENVEVPLSSEDISYLQTQEKQQKTAAITAQVFSQPFDLATPPLIRTVLIKQAGESFLFIYNMHHIITDGWSMSLLETEFKRLYDTFAQGKKPGLAPLTVQYKDFTAWQNRRIQEPEFKAKVHRYWQEKLADGFPVLKLPYCQGGNREDKAGASFRCVVQRDIKDRLKQMAQQHNTTLFTILFSMYNLLLAYLSGQEEIAAIIISAGRPHLALHSIIGYFINPIIMKTRVDLEGDFDALLNHINREVLEAFQYQDYPFEKVIAELNIKPPDVTTAFNMLNLENISAGTELDSLESYHNPAAQDVKFDIALYLTEYPNGIEIRWDYRKTRFKPETIANTAAKYIQLMAEITGAEEDDENEKA